MVKQRKRQSSYGRLGRVNATAEQYSKQECTDIPHDAHGVCKDVNHIDVFRLPTLLRDGLGVRDDNERVERLEAELEHLAFQFRMGRKVPKCA